VHRERGFYRGLVDFMMSGPVVVQVLEGENAVAKNREVMGATDPKKADPGTIRAQFAEDIEANSVHGSDSAENARRKSPSFSREPKSSAGKLQSRKMAIPTSSTIVRITDHRVNWVKPFQKF